MSWKNYLFFQKQDKNAITLLLLLLVFSGGGYIICDLTFSNSSKQADISKDYLAQTILLEQQLEDVATGTGDYPIPQHPIKLKEGQVLDINIADTTALKRIPGIGSSYARRIVEYRDLLGGYIDLEQLKEVKGIKEGMFKKIKYYLTVSTNDIRRIKINKTPEEELAKHPYINEKQLDALLQARANGTVFSVKSDMLRLRGFTGEDIDKLSAYLIFD